MKKVYTKGIFNGVKGWWYEVPYEFTGAGILTEKQVNKIRKTHKQYNFIPWWAWWLK